MLALEDLQSLVTKCTDPFREGFYRRVYGMQPYEPALSISSMDAWLGIRLITKDDLIAQPLSIRSHIPLSEIDHLRTSSGTSGKPPLFSPRTPLRSMEYRFAYHDFKKPILSYSVPAMPHWHEQVQKSHGIQPRVIAFDPKHAAASVRLARIAGVDSISLFAFHIPLVAEHFVREGANNTIRFIEIAGEACTRFLFEFMRSTFPNAVIVPFYGSSEVEDCPMGMPCRPITGEEPLSLYHGKESHYLELIDPDTLSHIEPKAEAEGELVITAYPGEPASFPLLRYRSGDMVRVVDEQCPVHGTWSFTILGRTAMDFLKVPGGVIRADEIERVLRSISERVTDRFELHCFEKQTSRGPQLVPVLHVEPKGEVNFESLAEEIAGALRVAPHTTYADGVASGRYAPLTCETLKTGLSGKVHRVVRHTS